MPKVKDIAGVAVGDVQLSLRLGNILSTIHNDHATHKYLSSNSASSAPIPIK